MYIYIYVLVVFKLLTGISGIFLFYIRHVPYIYAKLYRYEERDPSKLCDTQDGIENIMINVIELILSSAKTFFLSNIARIYSDPVSKTTHISKYCTASNVFVIINSQQCIYFHQDTYIKDSRCEPCKGFPPIEPTTICHH